MSPVLQTLIALTICVLLCLFFLRKMSFAVGDHLPHVVDVVLVVFAWILLGILFKNGDNLASAVMPNCLAGSVILRPIRNLGPNVSGCHSGCMGGMRMGKTSAK